VGDVELDVLGSQQQRAALGRQLHALTSDEATVGDQGHATTRHQLGDWGTGGGVALAAVGLPATIGEYSEPDGLSPRHVTPFHRNLNTVITFLN